MLAGIGASIAFVRQYWKLFAMKAYAMLVAYVYMRGRRTGKEIEQANNLRQALESEKKRSEFHTYMGKKQNENINSGPRNKSDLIDRLRNNGGL